MMRPRFVMAALSAVMAVSVFSAGGIQAGEFPMHYDEDVNGTALDSSYILVCLPTLRRTAAG